MIEERKPPYSEDAEQAVLGAMLMDDVAITKASEILEDSSFYREAHRRLFRAFKNLLARGSIVDPLTLANELGHGLDASGGKDYIGYLMDVVPTAANVQFHARIILELAERRRLIEIGSRMISEGYSGEAKASDVAAAIQTELLPVATATGKTGYLPASELVDEMYAALERAEAGEDIGVTSGYTAIDTHTGGEQPGDLIFICGVPGSGKTAIALNMMQRSAKAGIECAFISAEMPRLSLVRRLAILDAPVSMTNLRKFSLTQLELNSVGEAMGAIKRMKIHVDDTGMPRIDLILARARALKAKHPALRKGYVDFIQLVQADDRDGNRSAELTHISYALKGLAKELGITVIATCQVDATEVEKTSDNRPQLKHLRWSQAMREAGDIIYLVYLPGMYDIMAPDTVELRADKVRDLARFKVELKWVKQYMRVDEPAYKPQQMRAM